MNVEALIFDIDGTLWDSRALVAEGYNLQLRAEGYGELCVSAETLRPLFGKVMTEIADAILAAVPPPERYALMARCMETENRYLAENPCKVGYDGVPGTLAALSRGCRLFIVSNSQCGYPELCIGKLGLAPYISGHLCFGDTGTGKGATVRTLMARYAIRSAAYVGDTQGDLAAAREAGIPFVFAAYGFGTAEGYDAKIDRFPDLLNLFPAWRDQL